MNPRAEAIQDPLHWNELVASFAYSSALQGWGFGEVKRLTGWTPHRLALSRGGEVFAAVQVLRRAQYGVSFLYAPRGPALHSLADLEHVAVALKNWAGRTDVSLKIEPPVPLAEEARIPERLGSWAYAESINPEHTVLLDLSQGEEKLLANMHQMARRNTKQSLKVGVTTQTEDDFETFWALFAETNTRSSLLQRSRGYYEAVLRECNAHGAHAAIITARLEGVPLATGMVIGLGAELDYLYGGSTKEHVRKEGERDPKGPNGFYWGMLQHGVRAGYKHLDLFGIPRKLAEDKHSFGVYQFKERLGGKRVHYPAYELALSPLAGVVGSALRLRKNWINYRARGSTDDVL